MREVGSLYSHKRMGNKAFSWIIYRAKFLQTTRDSNDYAPKFLAWLRPTFFLKTSTLCLTALLFCFYSHLMNLSSINLLGRTGVTQLKHVLKVIIGFKGAVIIPETTLKELLYTLGKSMHPMFPLDATCLVMPIIFDDFLEMICRLVASEFWIDRQRLTPGSGGVENSLHPESSGAPATRDGLTSDSHGVPRKSSIPRIDEERSSSSAYFAMGEAKILETVLVERLTRWLDGL